MVLQIILADILLVARIFPSPPPPPPLSTQLVKYPRVLSVKPSNKGYLLFHYYVTLPYKDKRTRKIWERITL